MAEATTPVIAPRSYRSIFLADEWAHQLYFGWAIATDLPGIRVLQKRRGPVCRSLILLTRGGEDILQGELTRVGKGLSLNDIYIHDFDRTCPSEEGTSRYALEMLQPGRRLLNIATYVSDLLEPADALEKNMGAKSRNMVRKAETAGARFVVSDGDGKLLDAFFEQYLPLARERKLGVPDRAVLSRMEKDGHLLLTACVSGAEDIEAISALYRAGATAYYMYGAGARRGMGGAGQFLQWRNMLFAKDLGCEWYDFGGVPDPQVMDGIHAFKKSMGGVLVDLGDEYRSSGPLVAAGERLLNVVRGR